VSGTAEKSTRPRRRARTPWARKRRRLLFVVGALFLLAVPPLAWRLSLAGEVRAALAMIEAEGRPTSLADLYGARDPLTPEENGATLYREASGAFRDASEELRESLPFRGAVKLPPGESLSPESLAAMEALVSINGPALALLREAAGKPACRHIETYELREERRDLSHLDASDSLSTLLSCDAVLRAEGGDLAGAWGALSAALALARSLEDDGLYGSLLSQWRVESRILEALQHIAGAGKPPGEILDPIRFQINTARRIEAWRRMCDVEQALFLARLSAGRRRGVIRSLIVVAGGVGDLNLRAYLAVTADSRAAFGLPLTEQQPMMDRLEALRARAERRPILYVTLHLYRPLLFYGSWSYMRAMWDEAAVAETALAALAFRGEHGTYPETLSELEPDWLAAVPETLSGNSPLHYRREGHGFQIGRDLEGGTAEVLWVIRGQEPPS